MRRATDKVQDRSIADRLNAMRQGATGLFDQAFIEALANRVADVVLARLNRPAIEKRYMSVEEAAIYTGYSVGALQKHIQRGHLPVSKEGTSTRVDKTQIDKWMARNRQ